MILAHATIALVILELVQDQLFPDVVTPRWETNSHPTASQSPL
jgi:hypothetical protein